MHWKPNFFPKRWYVSLYWLIECLQVNRMCITSFWFHNKLVKKAKNIAVNYTYSYTINFSKREWISEVNMWTFIEAVFFDRQLEGVGGPWSLHFNFWTKQGPTVSTSNIRDIAFYECSEITRTRNFTIFTVFTTIFGQFTAAFHF